VPSTELDQAILKDSLLLHNIQNGIIITDLQGIVKHWNAASKKLTQSSDSEILGKKLSSLKFFPSDLLPSLDEKGDIEPIEEEYSFIKGTEEKIWVKILISPFRNAKGESIGIIYLMQDITHDQQVKHELQRKERLLHRSLELSETGIWDWNLENFQPYWSRKMLDIYGYESLSEIPPYTEWSKTIHPEDREWVLAEIRNSLENKGAYNITFRMVRESDDDVRHLHAIGEVIRDENSGVEHLIGLARDISSKQATDKQLKELLEFNQNIVQNAIEGIVVLNPGLECIIWNPTMEHMFHLHAFEAIEKSIFEILPFDSYKKRAYQRIFRMVLRGHSVKFEDSFEVELSGVMQTHWLRMVLSPNFKEGEEVMGIIAIISDISENKKKEFKLVEYSERLRLASETAGIGIWKLDLITQESEWNKELYDMYGVSPEQIQESPNIWEKTIHPEDYDYAMKQLHRVFEGEEVQNIEFRIIRQDGEVRYINASGKGIWDTKGRVIQGIGINLDVTHLKKNEASLKEANEELKKINHTLDTFVYHTSHNLRAPLANIMGILEILDRNPSEAERERFIRYGIQNVKSLDETIQRIIDYSYNSRAEQVMKPIRVKLLVDNIFSSLSLSDLDFDSQMINEIPEELSLYTDAERLRMVFLNLLSNALKYSDPQKEKALVHISALQKEDGYEFRIRDNGIGIPQEQQAKIFDMFFRASQQGKGSGLGLYIVYEVMEQLSGRISFESEEGKGSTFILYFPSESRPMG